MSSRPHPESERPMRGPLQSFDLGEEAARLREEGAFRGGRRNSITLRKGEGMSVVLLVMGVGDRLEEHAAPGPISVAVWEGRIRFITRDEEVVVGPETVLACDAGVRHAVEALEDTVCVVTIARRGELMPVESAACRVVDLARVAAAERGLGVVWTQEEGEDLNANLVRLEAGEGVGVHRNGEVDVVFVSVSGSSAVVVNGEEYPLEPGRLVYVPKGSLRATRSGSGEFAYLTIHRRRRPVRVSTLRWSERTTSAKAGIQGGG